MVRVNDDFTELAEVGESVADRVVNAEKFTVGGAVVAFRGAETP